MPELECKICYTLMDNEVYLPRMLSCGHTYCSKCLQNILESVSLSPSFPRCRKSISSKNVVDYPVNYDLLEMTSSLTKREQNKKQLLKIKSELEDLKSMKNKIDSAEEQLNVLIVCNDSSLDEENEEELTDKIKELGETVKEIMPQTNVSKSDIKLDVQLRCKDYGSALHLMAEIQKEIQANGQKFAAVLKIDGVKKFAKISFSEKCFFIHAFDTYEDDCEFVTVCFQDLINGLLRCEIAKGVHGFLELTYQPECFHRKAMVKVTDSTSFLGSQFLQLCTGETGTSIKGLEYSQEYETYYIDNYVDQIIELKNFGWDLETLFSSSINSPALYNMKSAVESKSCFLTCDIYGSVKILRNLGMKSVEFPYVIGPIVDFNGDFAETFEYATQCKVLDCGIAFAL